MTRLLVVDDEPRQLKLAVLRLELEGFEVTPATGAEQAIALIQRDAPDVVISDVVMPDVDGFGLCERLRADPALAHVPVLLVTNSTLEQADRLLARRAGARELIMRTPDFADIIAAIRGVTG